MEIAKLIIGEVVHDDKKSIDSQVSKMIHLIFNSKDLWHCTKNKMKDFSADLVQKKRLKCVSVESALNKAHLRDLTINKLKDWLKEDNKKKQTSREKMPTRKEDLVQEVWSRLVDSKQRVGDGNAEVLICNFVALTGDCISLQHVYYYVCACSAYLYTGHMYSIMNLVK